jgi:transposase-like protein
LVVAQRHGISKSLLYNWRSAWKAAGLAARARAVPPTEFGQMSPVSPLRHRNSDLIIRHNKISGTLISRTIAAVTAETLSTNNGVRISLLRSAIPRVS